MNYQNLSVQINKWNKRSNEEGHTGENSNNAVDEFVINPNKIKRLKDLGGITGLGSMFF